MTVDDKRGEFIRNRDEQEEGCQVLGDEERDKTTRRVEETRKLVIRAAWGSLESGRLLAAGSGAEAEVLWRNKTERVSLYLPKQ